MSKTIHSGANPCPFCGERELEMFCNIANCYIQCQTCTTTGPDGADEESALIQWNKRAWNDQMSQMLSPHKVVS